MALDFLSGGGMGGAGGAGGGSDPFGMLSSLFNLGGQGAALNTVSKGYQQTQAEEAQRNAMEQQNALLQAMLDSNNPIYKNVLNGQQQQLNTQTQAGLQNLMQAQRRSQLMGRGTFFNPERQDEAINQFMTKQNDANAVTARSNALQQLIQAANGYGASARGYGDMIKTQQNAQNVNNAALPSTLGGLGGIMGQFGNGGSMSGLMPGLMNMFGGSGGGAGGAGGFMSMFGGGAGGAGAAEAGSGAVDLGEAMPWLTEAAASAA